MIGRNQRAAAQPQDFLDNLANPIVHRLDGLHPGLDCLGDSARLLNGQHERFLLLAPEGDQLQVLALDQDLTPAARVYATLAGVAGEMSAGRRKEAAELLEAQGRHLPASELETPWFRYLVFSMRTRPVAPQP